MVTAATKPQPVLVGPTADTIPVSVPGDTTAGDSRGTVTVSIIVPIPASIYTLLLYLF